MAINKMFQISAAAIFAVTACLTLVPAAAQLELSSPSGQQEDAQAPVGEDPQAPVVNVETPEDGLTQTGNGNIKFSFVDTEWNEVIKFFADLNGYSYRPPTQMPTGTFTYFSDEEYTPTGGMDLLNNFLSLENPPYTLIRNDNALILRPSGQLPDNLIETVTSEELYERGLYEYLRCEFDLAGLEGTGITDDLSGLVTTGRFNVINAAKKLIVVETGAKLRIMDRHISSARQSRQVFTYSMKFVDTESLLIVVRDMMQLDEFNEDMEGKIKITVEPLGDRLFVYATEAKYEEFLKFAETIDVDAEAAEIEQKEPPFVRKYPVYESPELTMQVLQTALQGREVNLDQDAETGTIVLRGRTTDHELALLTLNQLSESVDDYDFIELRYIDADDAILTLRKFFPTRIDEVNNLILSVDSYNNQILVKGTPQEVAKVRKMCQEMEDFEKQFLTTGPRSNSRLIEMDNPDEAADLIGMTTELWRTTGNPNTLNIVMPEDRERVGSGGMLQSAPAVLENQMTPEQMLEQMQQYYDRQRDLNNQAPSGDGVPRRDDGASHTPQFNLPLVSPTAAVFSMVSYQPQEDETQSNGSGDTTADEPMRDDITTERDPEIVAQETNVPGSPVQIRWTPYGIALESDDLEALDDMERLIRARLKNKSVTSAIDKPVIFPIVHVEAAEIKARLDNMFGLASSGSGGGGGGMTDMMGNIASNAMGNAAGGLLDGLFGPSTGGSSGGGGAIELEGLDVTTSVDGRLNWVIVAGATRNDIDLITEIIRTFDRKRAPQEIDMVDVQVIEVRHRDVQEILAVVQAALPEYILGAGGEAGQPEQPNMQQVIEQMMAGNQEGGGGGAQPNAEMPKAVVSADIPTNTLIVAGPYHIYQRINGLVLLLDLPEDPVVIQILDPEAPIDMEELRRALAPISPRLNVELGDGSEEEGEGGNGSSRTGSEPSASISTGGISRDQMRQIQQFQERMQQFQRGGGQGGGRGGRGGGGGGGGGRGGRG